MSQPQLTFLLCLILAMSAMGQIGSGIPNTQSTFGQPFTQGQSSLASWGGLSGMGSFAPQLGGSQQAGFGGFPGQQTGFGGLAGQQSAYGGLLGQNTGFGGLTGQQTGFGGLAGQQTGFGGLAGQQSAYGGLLGQNTGFGGLTGQQSTYGGLLGQNTGFGAGFGQQTVGSTPITTSEVTSGSTVQTSAPGPVPVASDTTTDVSNKCHNIIDSDFMSFSTYCSVLPQTTYALPNFFGHDDKFQVNQLLDSIKPLMDSMCYKNIRMFTCPLLFPPCDGEPILPCAKLCRMIKQSCNAFELSFVDCDRLPENAAFCPALDSLPRSNNNNYNYESARTVEKDYSYAGVTQKSNLISSLPERPRDAYRQSFTTPIRTISKVSQDSWTVGDLSKARLDSSYTRAVPLSPPSSYQSAPLMTQTTSYSSTAPLSPSTSYSSAVPLSPPTSYGSAVPLSPSTSYSSAVPLSPSTSYGSAVPLSPSTSYSSAVPLSLSTSYSSAAPLSPSTSYSSAVPLSPSTSYGSAVPLSASRLRTSSLRLAKTRLTSDSYAAPVPLTPINTYGSAKITTKSNSYSTAAPLSSSIVLGSRSSLTGAHQTGYGLPSGNSYQSFQNIEIPAYNPCLDQVVENPCRIDGASFYPVPQKPECFVQCDMDRMYVKPCPKYLVWNPVHNICDWPSNITVEVIPTVSAPVSSYGRKKRSSGARFVPFRSTVSNDGSYSQIPTVSFAENSRVLSNIAPAVATLRTTNEGYGSATPITEFKNMNTIRTVGGNYGSAPTAASLLTVPSSRQNVLTRTVPTFHTTTSARTVSNLVSIPKTLPSSGYGGFTKSFVSTPYSTQVIQSAPVDYQSTNVAQAIFEEEVNAFECGPEAPSNPCFKDGPQFFPMTTNPSCYIHCSNGIGYVRPCPRGLTWNVEIDACDWLDMPETVVVPPVPQQPSLISYGSYSGAQQNAYGRKKRSTTERKKRFMPFLPEFLDPIRSKAVIGPNLPGIVPLPGLPGPIGFPGPLYPPFAPPIIPPFLPPFFPPPIGPIPPPILPPPLFPGFGLPPPFLPGVGLPPPIFPGIGLPPPFFPGIGLPAGAVSPILPLLPPFPPNFFGADLLVDGFGKRSGGGFPFGDDFGGGFPGEFFDPVPLHDDHHSNYNGKYDSYSSYDDHNDYGHSNKYNYKKNGNFKSYKSRDYGGSYKKNNYDDYSNNYYRKRRDYGQQMIPGTSFGMMNPMQSFMNDYSSQSIPSNPIPFNSYGQQMQTFSLPLPVQHEPVAQATLQPPVLIPSSPCANQNGKGNIAHPTDPTKYIACLTRTKYEIMDCPAGLIYEADIDQCQDIKRPLSLCERENLCLNGGQCYETGPETFKCTCRGAWTGERCETPVSSCASNPCGDGNECHTLFAADYKQDYVCFCSGSQSYGLSCDRNTVPNPCMTETGERETYYPFAFSAHAYVQCNGESMFVLACASDLMWFQSSKVCSREETFIAAPVLDKPISQDSSYSTGYQTESYSRPTVTTIDKTVDKQQGSRYRSYSPHMTIESSRQFNKLVSRPNLNTDYGSYSSFVPIEPFIDERIEKPRIMELPKTSIANQMPRFMPRLFRTTAWQSNNVLDTKKSSQY